MRQLDSRSIPLWRRLWLAGAQALVLAFAALYVLQLFRGEAPAPRPAAVVSVKEAAEPPRAAPMELSFSDAAAKATASVVNIYTAKTVRRSISPEERLLRRYYGLPEDEAESGTSLGSGVIVSADGYLLTNNHVIEGADEIAVVLASGAASRAQVVGTDPETDLAVLKIDGTALSAITFGDSDRLKVGDVVLAVGNPFGVGQTVTMGIVSATGRNRLGINAFENFIQTDAPINPGNSGGALVDSRGHLVGINTAIFSQTGSSAGIGFAVPVKTARDVMVQLIKTGRVERGWIGAELADVSPELAARFRLQAQSGAVIVRLLRGGPAERAGVRPGDLLVAVQDKPVADAAAAVNAIVDIKAGESARLGLRRGAEQLALVVSVGRRPPASAERAR